MFYMYVICFIRMLFDFIRVLCVFIRVVCVFYANYKHHCVFFTCFMWRTLQVQIEARRAPFRGEKPSSGRGHHPMTPESPHSARIGPSAGGKQMEYIGNI